MASLESVREAVVRDVLFAVASAGDLKLSTQMGEYLVGAYLKIIEGCDIVVYNLRPPGGGLKGLGELDVLGLRFRDETAYLCEVTTHIGGLLIRSNKHTVEKIRDKYRRQRKFAASQLKDFPNRHFQFWSPVVPVGYLTTNLPKIGRDLDVVINADYTRRIDELRIEAKKRKNNEENPAFRMLQILEHLRRLEEPAEGAS